MLRRLILRDLVVNTIAASVLVPLRLRWLALRAYGIRIERAAVREGCFFGGNRVVIAAGAYVNAGVLFDGHDEIRVGPRVHVGMQAMILTGGHDIGPPECRAGDIVPGPVTIEEGAWIGARVILMPGVTIGAGAVIAAGAVVTRSCEANGVYGGVPARKLRSLVDGAS